MLSGTLSLRERVRGRTARIGLVDLASLEDGSADLLVGAFISVSTNADGDVRIAVTDGNDGGGELVERSIEIPADDVPDEVEVTFTVDGTVDPRTCATPGADVETADGCLTLQISGEVMSTVVVAADFDAELAEGAVPGWAVAPAGESGVHFDLAISPAKVHEVKAGTHGLWHDLAGILDALPWRR